MTIDQLMETARPELHLFRQYNLEADVSFNDFRTTEFYLRQHVLKLFSRIGTLQQHRFERQSRQKSVDRRQRHSIHVIVDHRWRSVSSQIDEQTPSTRLQDSTHLAQRTNRIAKILESRAAQEKIKLIALKGHL